MKTVGAVAGALLLCLTTSLFGQQGLPSNAQLAEMGLAGMEIMSDHEAAQIRVRGYSLNRWGNLYPFVQGVSRLQPRPPMVRPVYYLR